MAATRLLLLGASGFGREVLWVVDDIRAERGGVDVVGFLDDDVDGARVRLAALGVDLPVLGPIRGHAPRAGDAFFCAIGRARARLAVAEALRERGAEFMTLVHPSARVHPSVSVGAGVLLSPLTTLEPNSRVGDFVVLNSSAAVRADAVVEDGCFVGAHCEVMSGAYLARGAFLGGHVSVECGVRVGAFATVGSGSAVRHPVPPEASALGVPANVLAL